jgi:predicted transcriptional regulator of viral defense system
MIDVTKISLTKAITLYLGGLNQPVITKYYVSIVLHKLLASKKIGGEQIKIFRRKSFGVDFIYKQLDELVDNGVLTPNMDFPKKEVFNITGNKRFDESDIACAVDPFCYVSHLTAMAYHGITDRIPRTLFITRPDNKTWAACARERMDKDFGNYQIYKTTGLPRLKKIAFNKINGRPVKESASIHHGAFKIITDRSMRVSSIGRTLLDMIRKPSLCGGIRHVQDVYMEYAANYLDLIIDEVDGHGTQIEKVRVGYMLEEACGIKDKRTEKWLQFVQRGGSRKLDPESEYSSNYSARWCLSINI